MFYNVIGLSFVSCFICSVVNAIDDFKTMRETARWAVQSVRKTALKAKSSNTSRTANISSSPPAIAKIADPVITDTQKMEVMGKQLRFGEWR